MIRILAVELETQSYYSIYNDKNLSLKIQWVALIILAPCSVCREFKEVGKLCYRLCCQMVES
jgi:hypothetical protein